MALLNLKPIFRFLPLVLTTLRLLMAPLILWAAYHGFPRWVFVIALAIALVTDIFDGIIARRLGVATALLRRYDSASDLVFYLAVLGCAWILYPAIVKNHAWGIAAILLLEAANHAVSLVRFGKPQATHCYSAKLWGILLFASFVALLSFGNGGMLLTVTIIVGCVAEVEALAILLTVPRWPGDVASFFHTRRRGRVSVCEAF